MTAPERAPEAIAREMLMGNPGVQELGRRIAVALRSAREAGAKAERSRIMPVECLSGHLAPLDEWGQECQTCAAVKAERSRIAAELREEAKGLRGVTWGKSTADYGASLLENFADRLEAPAPEGT